MSLSFGCRSSSPLAMMRASVLGAVIGMKASLANAQLPRERQMMVRFMWFAMGGVAMAWHAAMGGAALARTCAGAGLAHAAHANDALARAFADGNGFFRVAHSILRSNWFWFSCCAPMLLALCREAATGFSTHRQISVIKLSSAGFVLGRDRRSGP